MKLASIALVCLSLSNAHADSSMASSQSNASASSVSNPVANAVSNSAGGFGGMGGLGGAGGLGGTGIGGGGGIGQGGAGGTAQGGIGEGGNGYGQGGIGQGGAATNTGNSQSLHFDQVRQSPAVFMNAPMPTAPCQASIGGFLSFIGGIGVAGSRTLQECEKRETSRIAYSIGEKQIALEIMCMTEYGAKTSVCSKFNPQ